MKYHVGSKGELSQCEADVKACPLGGVEHFVADSPQEAQKMFEDSMAAQHGVTATVKNKGTYDKPSVEMRQNVRDVQDLMDEYAALSEKKSMLDAAVDQFSDENVTDGELVWNMPKYSESVEKELNSVIARDTQDGAISETMSTAETRAYQLDILRVMQEDVHDEHATVADEMKSSRDSLGTDETMMLRNTITPKIRISTDVAAAFEAPLPMNSTKGKLVFKSKQELFEESGLSANDFAHGYNKLVQDSRIGDRDETTRKMALVYTKDGVSRWGYGPKDDGLSSNLLEASATPVQRVGDNGAGKMYWVGSVVETHDEVKVGDGTAKRNCPHNHRSAVAAQSCSEGMVRKLKAERVPKTRYEAPADYTIKQAERKN